MAEIHLFTIGFRRPDLLWHQNRLLKKNLKDDHVLHLVDNTWQEDANSMRTTAKQMGIEYLRPDKQTYLHPDALNYAAGLALAREYDYYGFIDHDVFPRSPTTLIEKIDASGFFGIGQRHAPTQTRYLFPGFAFFSKQWVSDRRLNFDGIRAIDKRNDGDCGSMLGGLFSDEDWERMHRTEHGYGAIRPEDGIGLQSWGYEVLDGAWVHFTNASRWMEVPEPQERERLLREMLEAM